MDDTTRDYVLRNIHRNRTPVAHVYYMAQRELKEYWELPETLAQTPAQYRLYEEWQRAGQPRAMTISSPAIRDLDRRVELRRQQMRQRNRRLDDLLVAFYDRAPAHPANIAESRANLRPQFIRQRVLKDAERLLQEASGVGR